MNIAASFMEGFNAADAVVGAFEERAIARAYRQGGPEAARQKALSMGRMNDAQAYYTAGLRDLDRQQKQSLSAAFDAGGWRGFRDEALKQGRTSEATAAQNIGTAQFRLGVEAEQHNRQNKVRRIATEIRKNGGSYYDVAQALGEVDPFAAADFYTLHDANTQRASDAQHEVGQIFRALAPSPEELEKNLGSINALIGQDADKFTAALGITGGRRIVRMELGPTAGGGMGIAPVVYNPRTGTVGPATRNQTSDATDEVDVMPVSQFLNTMQFYAGGRQPPFKLQDVVTHKDGTSTLVGEGGQLIQIGDTTAAEQALDQAAAEQMFPTDPSGFGPRNEEARALVYLLRQQTRETYRAQGVDDRRVNMALTAADRHASAQLRSNPDPKMSDSEQRRWMENALRAVNEEMIRTGVIQPDQSPYRRVAPNDVDGANANDGGYNDEQVRRSMGEP